MKKWKEQWQQMLPYERVLYVISCILGVGAIITMVLDVLHISNAITLNFDPYIMERALIALGSACVAARMWRTARTHVTVWIFLTVYCAFCAVLHMIW